MTTGRRQNKLTKVDKTSDAKQQLSYSDLLHSFILDCKSKNLSPLTIRFYQDGAKQLEAAFRDQEIELDIYSVTSRDIKNHLLPICSIKENQTIPSTDASRPLSNSCDTYLRRGSSFRTFQMRFMPPKRKS